MIGGDHEGDYSRPGLIATGFDGETRFVFEHKCIVVGLRLFPDDTTNAFAIVAFIKDGSRLCLGAEFCRV